MSKIFTSRYIIKILEKRGFLFISQKGSHVKYRKITKKETLTVVVPIHSKEIPVGTFKSILRQSKLTKEDFIKK
ncbi:type II toxin-antitoxin system HicA family toxin [Patescibacteria group bacterium]|nr:type II toxin-antitoxin system HicA family toxin [Patescibacteria group bacterium]MBU3923180.1 type II toxin-antitoxin system HicA family toxin [Patescibacteria group bacterium]